MQKKEPEKRKELKKDPFQIVLNNAGVIS